MDVKQVRQFVNEREKRISDLSENLNRRYWEASLSGEKEDYEGYANEEIKLKELLSNKEDFEILENLK
jgi:hypothetical protein